MALAATRAKNRQAAIRDGQRPAYFRVAVSALQPRALILLVAVNDVPSARRRRDVLLALEIAVDHVVGDLDTAAVLERLHVGVDLVAEDLQERRVLVVENIPG